MRQLTLGVLLVGGGFLAGLAFQPELPAQVVQAITGRMDHHARPAQLAAEPPDATAEATSTPTHVHAVASGATSPAAGPSGAGNHGHTDPGPGDPACGLTQVAFCDTFDSPFAFSRSGALNPRVWSVARLSQNNNPSQGAVNTWAETDAMHCKDLIHDVTAPNDLFECGPAYGESNHFMDAINDAGGYVYNSARVRQPFDFAGRTGTVTFSVDAQTKGEHSFWVEVWITDEPVPAPHSEATSVQVYPKNGVGLIFSDDCDQPGEQTRLRAVHVVHNYIDQASYQYGDLQSECFTTMADMMNRFEIHISTQRIEVTATDAGAETERQVAVVDGLQLPLSRGYLHVQHVQYNAAKFGTAEDAMHTYHWDNIGFDGPVLPMDRGYDVPDALTPAEEGGALNLGYVVSRDGIEGCCPETVINGFRLTSVDPAGITGARLSLDIETSELGARLRYRLNGGAWHETPVLVGPGEGYAWRGLSIAIDPRELRAGDNVVELAATAEVTVANVGVDLQLSS
ncbi:MAG TPA: hypothetical protein VFA63_09470 [Pseudonocardiaceae bacterium]|nr:hypothetical protein [Pseudonocardiaceae bacterium]